MIKKIIAIQILIFITFYSYSEDNMYAEFDGLFLGDIGSDAVDVSRFYYGNPINKGDYVVEIYVNEKFRGTKKITVKENSPNIDVTKELCITPDIIKLFDLKENIDLSNSCTQLDEIIPLSTATFNMSGLTLDISMPQANIIYRPDDYIPPSSWDNGTTAGFISYSFSDFNYKSKGQSTSSNKSLAVNGGTNIAGWKLRHNGYFNQNIGNSPEYTSYGIYAEHDIDEFYGRLTLGDFTTSNNLMSNFSIRGMQIASDMQMIPQSQRIFRPEVNGVANTNASIQIKQNNKVIYETVVPPGPFSIRDFHARNFNGDLKVTVLEADGSRRDFIVPFDSARNLMTPATYTYQFALGRYRDCRIQSNSDYVANASYEYGLNNTITLNLGGIFSENYYSELVGGIINLPYGALSSDVTLSHTKSGNKWRTGYSIHSDYSISLGSSNTELAIAVFRYSSEDYHLLSEAMNIDLNEKNISHNYLSTKNQYSLNVNQKLPHGFGRLYASLYRKSYWRSDKKSNYVQINYNHHYKKLNYSLAISKNRSSNETQFSLSFSFPLGMSDRAPRMYTTATYYNNDYNYSTSFGDSFGENYQFYYSLAHSNGKGQDSYYSASGGYNSPYAKFNGSVSQTGQGNTQNSFGITGGIVVHPYGITLASELGNTFAVVHAKNGTGAQINNSSNNNLDWWGNGIYSYLTPYQYNNIGIDTKDAAFDVQFESTEITNVPRAHSIQLIDLKTDSGPSILINLTKSSGEVVPMGSAILLNDENIGIVGQDGQTYLRNLPKKSTLRAQWGDHAFCSFTYDSASQKGKNLAGFYIVDKICENKSN